MGSGISREINLEEYTDIIGGGGFGIIAKHSRKDEVVKLLFKSEDCNNAEIEFRMNRKVYESIKLIEESYPSLRVNTPIPIHFSNDPVETKMGSFKCYYSMSLINTLPNSKYLFHTVLKDEYENIMNKLISKNYKDPVSDENPARGIFYTYKKLDPLLNELKDVVIRTVKDISFRMGALFGICIFGSQLFPIDGEFVLSIQNNKLYLSLLDFGMFEQVDINSDVKELYKKYIDNFGIDIYLPYMDSYLYEDFKKGLQNTGEFFLVRKKNLFMTDFLNMVLNPT